MTGILVLIALAAVLVATLEITHHRSRLFTTPGQDLSNDRDYQRVRAELRAAAATEPGSAVASRTAPRPTVRRTVGPRIVLTHRHAG